MATERERAIVKAVEEAPAGSDVLVIDGRTGRAGAVRGNWANDGTAACIVVAGPIRLGELGMAIRPGTRDGDVRDGESGDFPLLAPEDRRRLKSERNKALHAIAARGATSAPVASSEPAERANVSDEADAPPTRPDDGPGSVQVI